MLKNFVTVLGSLCTLALLTSPLHAGATESAKKAAPAADEAMMMQKMMEAGKPGAEHKMLANMVGKWKVEIKEFHGSDTPAKTSKAVATFKTKFGGRYLEETFVGMMGKMKFEGMMTMAFDNMSKKYKSTWIESMGTDMLYMEGNFDEASKTFTSTGEYIDPMDSQKTMMKIVGRMVDANTRVHDFFIQKGDGKSMKMMEMTYKRM